MNGHASIEGAVAIPGQVGERKHERRRNDGLEAIEDQLLDADEQRTASLALLAVLGAGSLAGIASGLSAPDVTLEAGLASCGGYLALLCAVLVRTCLWPPAIPKSTRDALVVLRTATLAYGRRGVADLWLDIHLVKLHNASTLRWLNIVRLLAVAVPLVVALGVIVGAIFSSA